MKGYVIGELEVTDQKTYDDYRGKVAATVEQYGGKFLVRGGKLEGLEGAKPAGRLVILEFPSFDQAAKWYRSAEYAPLITLRQKGSKGRLILVEGA
ncbi:MAG: DUF1330 domain-containing protein [Alphaproteobacteria bacterium]|nr:DUF1330 domain-containing protein [Alphaproteobacteria bacterium]